ncbi:MAG: nicotinamide-nucleotide amidohydrolase family protein [Bullifex sp.]
MDRETASLIVIGSELTEGIIADKHGMVVSRELTALGYHMNQLVAIPDDGTVGHVLKALLNKNDIVIITGGLGPTSDDMTRSAVAQAAGKSLVKDEAAFERLHARVGERIWGANEKQAYFPEGFATILNPNGTAEGFYGEAGNTLVFCLPGPPREMNPMFYDHVLPYLARLKGHHNRKRLEYSTYLIAEAKLEELTKKASGEICWGTRFQDYRISLYAEGDEEKSEKAVECLREMVGPCLIEYGDVTALGALTSLLRKEKLTISTAESCTGGLAAMLLTEESGASTYFPGSVVSYSPEVKENVLGVSRETVEKYGVVSEECAIEMAEGVRKRTRSDYALSITGVAGPDKSEGKDVGTVCFGFAGRNRKSESVTIHFSSWGRASVRRKSATASFILMKAFIEGKGSLIDITSMWNYI